eukprot:3396453-Prorocentrum_lima.AAC.1
MAEHRRPTNLQGVEGALVFLRGTLSLKLEWLNAAPYTLWQVVLRTPLPGPWAPTSHTRAHTTAARRRPLIES